MVVGEGVGVGDDDDDGGNYWRMAVFDDDDVSGRAYYDLLWVLGVRQFLYVDCATATLDVSN